MSITYKVTSHSTEPAEFADRTEAMRVARVLSREIQEHVSVLYKSPTTGSFLCVASYLKGMAVMS